MANCVGRRYAYSEHIGFRSLTKILIFQDSLSHIKGHGDAFHIEFDVIPRLLLMGFVEVVDPCWQLIHIISARNEMAGTRIPPISCIGTMACWQD